MHDPVEEYQMSGRIMFTCLECTDVQWVTWVDPNLSEPCFVCGSHGMQKWKVDEIRLAELTKQSTL